MHGLGQAEHDVSAPRVTSEWCEWGSAIICSLSVFALTCLVSESLRATVAKTW